MTAWVDVVARARGLSGRLFTPEVLAELARSRDLHELATLLAARRARAVPETLPTPEELEHTERRHTAAQLRLLARWAGPRLTILAPLFEDEDRRTLRALIRGAVARTPPGERLAGLIPTAALPPRALAQLAAAGSPSSIAALLDVWGSPFGPPLLAETTRQQPDQFAMEHALVATWGIRARKSAKRAGRAMRTFVARQLDLANCWSALLVTEHGFDGTPADLFLEGGTLIPRAQFIQAATEKNRARAVTVLEPLVRRTPLAAATGLTSDAEERVRRALVHEQHSMARAEPLGLAPVIEYWLRLRGEAIAMQRMIWSIAAGVPVGYRVLEATEA